MAEKEKKESRAKSVLAGEHKKPGKHKTKSIHLHQADSGGFVAKHEMHPDGDGEAPEQEHLLPDMDALHAHMDQHAPAMGNAPDPEPAPAAAAPAAV